VNDPRRYRVGQHGRFRMSDFLVGDSLRPRKVEGSAHQVLQFPAGDLPTPQEAFDERRRFAEREAHLEALVLALQEQAVADEARHEAAENALAAQLLNAQNDVAARDELVAVVAHDLRSPLTVMALQASLMLRTLASESGVGPRRLSAATLTIQQAAARMSEMLHDLVDLSLIEHGRYQIAPARHLVSALFEDANALLFPLASAKEIELTFDSPCREPLRPLAVTVDGERFHQIMANLVGNAIKFTPEAGAIRVSAELDGTNSGMVRFTVTDCGNGMTESQMSHVFERYWRIRAANPSGSGLGLYIARGLVEAHGGSIGVESEPGLGSTFFFTLPTEAPAPRS
jgi:chemotaxis family two-component system sensor kinase Cph1